MNNLIQVGRFKIARGFGAMGFLLGAVVFASNVYAEPDENAQPKTQEAPVVNTEKKKLVDSATINLRTTVTGNQEQPRVLYILPWQAPESPELGIEMLSSQQDAVFGHIEREELLRGLEAAGELDTVEKTQ